jgi:cytidylate kinase
MYRAVALAARRAGVDWEDAGGLTRVACQARIELGRTGEVKLDGEDVSAAIREPEISGGASKVSAVSAVRRAMVERQQAFGRASDVVMEGRDIGTVVFPDAQVKIYLDASPEERARRRVAELAARGQAVDYEATLAEMRERDRRDMTRADSPLRRAADAIYIDTSRMSEAEVSEALARAAEERQ